MWSIKFIIKNLDNDTINIVPVVVVLLSDYPYKINYLVPL